MYGRTLAACREKLDKLRTDSKTTTAKTTLAEFITTKWLPHIERNCKRSTWERYESTARLHVLPAIGTVKLSAVDSDTLLILNEWLVKRNASTATRKNAYERVSETMAYAQKVFAEKGVTINNPSKLGIVKAVPHVSKKSAVLTREQLERFIEFAKAERLYAMFMLALFCGLRLGELFGLRLKDLDLDNGIGHVNEQLREGGDGKNTLGPPKTKTSVREFGIPDEALEALRAHVAKIDGAEPSSFVFTAIKGGGLRRSVFTRGEWLPFLRRAGLPRVTFHSLRSCTKTLHDRAGISQKVSMEILGHSSVDVHLGYARPDVADHQEAARRIGSLFGSEGSQAPG